MPVGCERLCALEQMDLRPTPTNLCGVAWSVRQVWISGLDNGV